MAGFQQICSLSLSSLLHPSLSPSCTTCPLPSGCCAWRAGEAAALPLTISETPVWELVEIIPASLLWYSCCLLKRLTVLVHFPLYKQNFEPPFCSAAIKKILHLWNLCSTTSKFWTNVTSGKISNNGIRLADQIKSMLEKQAEHTFV